MATPLDFALLKPFESIFPFIFVVTVTYCVLLFSGPFKDKKTVAGLLAFCLGVFTMFFPVATKAISLMAPWMVLLIIFLVFTLVGIQTLGITNEDVLTVVRMKEYSFIYIIIIILVILIGVFSLGKAVQDVGLDNAGAAQSELLQSGFLHPKIMGLLILLFIAFFTVQRLAAKEV